MHEHISMTLLKDADVPTPKFGVAKSAEEAKKIAAELDCPDLVIKAQVRLFNFCIMKVMNYNKIKSIFDSLQVLAGGRGKGHFKKGGKGGVQLVYTPEEAEEAAAGMIGDFLVTKQTGEAGRICNAVMVTERKYTRKEFYIAFMNERAFSVR